MVERDQKFQGNQSGNLSVSQPHFDDERTIQTAKPVVPLNPFWRILTRRRLALAGAFVLAAALGAGSALAIIQLRQPVDTNSSEASTTKEETDEQPVAEAQASEDLNEISNESKATETDVNSTTEDLSPTLSPKRPLHTRATQAEPSSPPRVTISIKTDDSQRQARLVDEWQERRQRRVGRPERQNNHHKRDLFRIREIFEGPRPE